MFNSVKTLLVAILMLSWLLYLSIYFSVSPKFLRTISFTQESENQHVSLNNSAAEFGSLEKESNLPIPINKLLVSRPVLEKCPKTPPDLVGTITYHHFRGKLQDLEKKFYNETSEPGGRFKPKECKALQKLALIIPYRDRKSDLIDFINHFIPFLKKQQLEFTIYVIEQGGNETFNRGLLMNVGFKESLKRDNYTCFIFHDVDMYPLHDHNFYRCEDRPKHMAVSVQQFGFRLLYDSYFGGAVAYNKKSYEMTNGFSNLYFGWGGEDDDQLSRLKATGVQFVRYSAAHTRYATARRIKDKTNPINQMRFKLLKKATARMYSDGLNSVVYNLTSVHLHKLYTHITITVNRQLIEKNWKV